MLVFFLLLLFSLVWFVIERNLNFGYGIDENVSFGLNEGGGGVEGLK